MIDALLNLFPRAQPMVDEAGPEDARAFAGLHALAFHRGWSEDEFETLLTERNIAAHRARIGRTFAGFILSRIARDEAEILSVAVARAWRGRGLGASLLTSHLALLERLGVRTIFLEVDAENESARKLYRRAGFIEAGQRQQYYQRGAAPAGSALVLRLDLT